MNPRLQKTISEIEKTKIKVAELQTRLRELEVQRTDLENTEIITLFRSVDVAPHELADFIRAYKEKPTQPPLTQSYQSSPAYQAEQEDRLDDEE